MPAGHDSATAVHPPAHHFAPPLTRPPLLPRHRHLAHHSLTPTAHTHTHTHSTLPTTAVRSSTVVLLDSSAQLAPLALPLVPPPSEVVPTQANTTQVRLQCSSNQCRRTLVATPLRPSHSAYLSPLSATTRSYPPLLSLAPTPRRHSFATSLHPPTPRDRPPDHTAFIPRHIPHPSASAFLLNPTALMRSTLF